MAQRPTIAVDFDGCLTCGVFPEIGPPRENVVALLRELYTRGWKVVIHTCRVNSDWAAIGESPERSRQKIDEMLTWLDEHEVPYSEVWGLALEFGGTWMRSTVTGKPVAHVYLDDRALNPVQQEGRALLLLCELLARPGDPAYRTPGVAPEGGRADVSKGEG